MAIERKRLWRFLREAVSKSGMGTQFWALIAAILVVAYALRLTDSPKYAVAGVSLVALGLILFQLLQQPPGPDAGYTRRLVSGAAAIVLATIVGLFVSLAFFNKPCHISKWLELTTSCDPEKKTLGVKIDRTSDFMGSGCEGPGKRILREVVVDVLQFDEDIKEHQITPSRNPTNNARPGVWYEKDDGWKHADVRWEPAVGNYEVGSFLVPVVKRQAKVKYEYLSHPPLEDMDFGPGFLNEKPITHLSVDFILPLGKSVLRKSQLPSHQERLGQMKMCQLLETGIKAKLRCSGQITEQPNKYVAYPIEWDVFADCSALPIKKARDKHGPESKRLFAFSND